VFASVPVVKEGHVVASIGRLEAVCRGGWTERPKVELSRSRIQKNYVWRDKHCARYEASES